MERLTLQEILHYAVKIEEESFSFYKTASQNIKDKAAMHTVGELAEDEIGHINWLKTLLNEEKVSAEELAGKVELNRENLEGIIVQGEIKPNASSVEILHIALEREFDTRDMYHKLQTLSNMNEDLRSLFSKLKDKEQGHADRISSIIKSYL
jgi:rubrerythrin